VVSEPASVLFCLAYNFTMRYQYWIKYFLLSILNQVYFICYCSSFLFTLLQYFGSELQYWVLPFCLHTVMKRMVLCYVFTVHWKIALFPCWKTPKISPLSTSITSSRRPKGCRQRREQQPKGRCTSSNRRPLGRREHYKQRPKGRCFSSNRWPKGRWQCCKQRPLGRCFSRSRRPMGCRQCSRQRPYGRCFSSKRRPIWVAGLITVAAYLGRRIRSEGWRRQAWRRQGWWLGFLGFQPKRTWQVGTGRVIIWVGFKTQPDIKWVDPWVSPIQNWACSIKIKKKIKKRKGWGLMGFRAWVH